MAFNACIKLPLIHRPPKHSLWRTPNNAVNTNKPRGKNMLALETPTLLTLFLNTQISRQATGLIKNCTIQYSYMAVDACIKLLFNSRAHGTLWWSLHDNVMNTLNVEIVLEHSTFQTGQGLKIAQWLPLILGPTEDSYEASFIMRCIPTLLRLLLNTQTPRQGKGLKLHNGCL